MIRILLVEDDELLRDIYVTILTDAGYSVESASDGQEGLEKITGSRWDLILLDIFMPRLTGIQVLGKLGPDFDTTRIIFMTNREPDPEMKESLQRVGGHIIKSAHTPDTFLQAVKRFL